MLKLLISAYGNPGRQDDGLGISFAQHFEKLKEEREDFSQLCIETNYQLNVEDAYEMKDYDAVIFVDATQETNVENFYFTKLKADLEIGFTTHAMKASSVLALCEQLYPESVPVTFILGIRGYEWGFVEELSSKANENLQLTISHFENVFTTPSIYTLNSKIKNK